MNKINSLGIEIIYFLFVPQNLSPLILFANWRSLVMIVTLFPWIAQRFVSSNSDTMYASAASWTANSAWLWNRTSYLNPIAISLTNLWKGSFLIRRSVDFWYFLISMRASFPGLWRFFTPMILEDFLQIEPENSCILGTINAVDFLANLISTSCSLSLLTAVDFLAIYLVLAMMDSIEWGCKMIINSWIKIDNLTKDWGTYLRRFIDKNDSTWAISETFTINIIVSK